MKNKKVIYTAVGRLVLAGSIVVTASRSLPAPAALQSAGSAWSATTLAGLPLIPPEAVPQRASFYRIQRHNLPPLPFNRYPGLPVYGLGDNRYLVDDRTVDYLALQEQAAVEAMLSAAEQAPGLAATGSRWALDATPAATYGPDRSGLWLELAGFTNNAANLVLHGVDTTTTHYYGLLSKPNLMDPQWKPEQTIETNGTLGADLAFTPVPTNDWPSLFFRAQQADVKVAARWENDAIRPDSAQAVVPGHFSFYGAILNENDADLAVYYTVSGTAVPGEDYGSLAGSATLTNGYWTYIVVDPTTNFTTLDATVTLTLIPTNTYVVDTDYPSATLTIYPATNLFTVVTNIPGLIGLDYDPVRSKLIASVNFYTNGWPDNFAWIGTNVTVTLSGVVSNVAAELPVAVVKTNAGGFTKGELFFGKGDWHYRTTDTTVPIIDKLSADGLQWTENWCVLTNETAPGTNLGVNGGLYVDKTGVFGYDLIAVTGNNFAAAGPQGVWRVNANGVPTLLANLPAEHLENVITLPNDPDKWGPWAGKILTGDKWNRMLYLVETNGNTTAIDTRQLIPGGISPEDFDLIPAGQDLYLCDPDYGGSGDDRGSLMKLSRTLLTEYCGDLLVTQGGELDGKARLFIVHWSGANFIVRSIRYQHADGLGHVEHVTFAPMDIQSQPQ